MGIEKGKERDGEGVKARGLGLLSRKDQRYFDFIPPLISDHRESF